MATQKKQAAKKKSPTKPVAKKPADDEEDDELDTSTDDEQDGDEDGTSTEPTWESFLAEQSDEVKALYEASIEKLKSTVTATRKEREKFKDQLKELSDLAKDNPELKKKIGELEGRLDAANKKADFFAEAPDEGCKNPKAAFSLAVAEELFTSRGLPDWDAIREEAPELFTDPSTLDSGGGEGSGGDRSKKRKKTRQPTDMNSLIRGAVGRG